jgi:hypothetical protein
MVYEGLTMQECEFVQVLSRLSENDLQAVYRLIRQLSETAPERDGRQQPDPLETGDA